MSDEEMEGLVGIGRVCAELHKKKRTQGLTIMEVLEFSRVKKFIYRVVKEIHVYRWLLEKRYARGLTPWEEKRLARVSEFLDQVDDPFYAGLKFFRNEGSQWRPVQGSISEEEWFAAIGNRDEDEESIETCELSICCATISAIRDILIKAKKNGGLLYSDFVRLESYISYHGPMDMEKCPNLARIVSLLGTSWEQLGDDD